MARSGLHLTGTLVVCGLLTSASAGWAQAPAAVPRPPVPTAAPASDDHAGAEDHVFALVQAGKCAQAKAAAEQADDHNLAEQIGLMCGAKSNGPSTKGASGGGRGRGGGASGGRRGGP